MSGFTLVNHDMTKNQDKDLTEAKKKLKSQTVETSKMVRVLTAEAALLAQKVVREAGRRER